MNDNRPPFGGIPGEFIAVLVSIPIFVILALLGWAFGIGPIHPPKEPTYEERKEAERKRGELLHERIKGAVLGDDK